LTERPSASSHSHRCSLRSLEETSLRRPWLLSSLTGSNRKDGILWPGSEPRLNLSEWEGESQESRESGDTGRSPVPPPLPRELWEGEWLFHLSLQNALPNQ